MKKILFYILLLFSLLGAYQAFSFLKNKPQKIPIPPLTAINTIEDIIQSFLANNYRF